MRIEVLHVADCPNLGLTRERLRSALEQLGLAAEFEEIEVASAAEAARRGMNGSPTILLDGRDPFPGAEPSLACRLYRNDGSSVGAPSVQELLEVLGR